MARSQNGTGEVTQMIRRVGLALDGGTTIETEPLPDCEGVAPGIHATSDAVPSWSIRSCIAN